MLSPILRCITQNTAVTRYFILVFFVAFLLCFNFFNSSVFSFPYFVKYTYDKMSEGLSLFYYPLYFVVGYYLHKFTLNKYFFRVVYVFGILSTVLLPVTAVICTIRQESTSLLFSYFFVLVFGESVFLFLSVRMLFDKIHFGEKFLAVISFLSKYTFGIYLVHIAVISLVKKTDVLAPLLFQIIAVLLISLLISFLLKHIPFVGKYLM